MKDVQSLLKDLEKAVEVFDDNGRLLMAVAPDIIEQTTALAGLTGRMLCGFGVDARGRVLCAACADGTVDFLFRVRPDAVCAAEDAVRTVLASRIQASPLAVRMQGRIKACETQGSDSLDIVAAVLRVQDMDRMKGDARFLCLEPPAEEASACDGHERASQAPFEGISLTPEAALAFAKKIFVPKARKSFPLFRMEFGAAGL